MSRLHWYGPKSHRPTDRLYDLPLKRARMRLYIPEEHWYPGSKRYGRDRIGPYVWMGTDCGWMWLATRPVVSRLPGWYRGFIRLCDHVHTEGAW